MDRFDALMILGAAVVAFGVGLWSIPAGIVVAGLALMGLGLIGARARSRGSQ